MHSGKVIEFPGMFFKIFAKSTVNIFNSLNFYLKSRYMLIVENFSKLV